MTRRDPPLVAEAPPRWIARATGWIVLAILVAAAVAVFVVHVPETVECAYALESSVAADPVRAPFAARVDAVRVREGQEVAAQGELFVLRPDGASNAPLVVRSPYDAIVLSVAEHSAGREVQSGQELCRLLRAGAPSRARLLVEETALARVIPGRRVRFFFDAFPSERYGTVTGTLDFVSAVPVETAEGARYVGTATLDAATIDVDGAARRLETGMRGTARIVVGERSLAEVLFTSR